MSDETPADDRLPDYCRTLPGATEDVKWSDNLVFSVGGKMFAVFGLPDYLPFSFKVDREAFAVLTRRPGIEPAPYLAKHSWIQLTDRDALPAEMVEDLLRDAHRLVAAKLSRKKRRELGVE